MRERQRGATPYGVLILAFCLSPLCLYGQTAAAPRSVQDVSAPAASNVQPGPFYALVIGNQNYRYLRSLQTPIDDAKAMAQLLHDSFGFQTTVLRDATHDDILRALNDYRKNLPANSNLLIYYAGHGYHDREADAAYWLPVDAEKGDNTKWISAATITSDIHAMRNAQHVLVISDSCYSGYMVRDDPEAGINPGQRSAYLAKMSKSKSRNLMSSGGDEPVADSGAPGHSVFAWAVMESLRQMNDDQFSTADVFYGFIRRKVGGQSEQLPQYSLIRNSGDDGGDFVFFRRPAAKAPPPVSSNALPPANPLSTRGPSGVAGGGGLPPGMDPKLADLYHRAQSGNPQAMADLGWYYAMGVRVPEDDKQAVVWYRKAADAGNKDGMTGLGTRYRYGSGVEQDLQQALSWYRKAANLGAQVAMYCLGEMYEEGQGVEKDRQQAVSWYRKAAQLGNVSAQNQLKRLGESP